MPEFTYPVQRAAPVNSDKLTEELKIAVTDTDGYRTQKIGEIIVLATRELTAPEVAAVTAAVTNHDPVDTAGQADAKVVSAAQGIALVNAKNYLRDQLRSASPNVTTIYTTVKEKVDGNPTLAQMLTNQQALMVNSFGWTLNLTTPTALDRQRYLLIVEMVISLIG